MKSDVPQKYIYSCTQVCNSEDPKQVVTPQFFCGAICVKK